ncbi:MAG: hypothetical protein MI725_06470 [Pirellulales bacterium]|nr:hypothetical protein [Pirellulales bacterium]
MSCSRFFCFALLLAVLIGASGCQQRVAAKLQGEWIGRADTAERRAAREAKKFGDESGLETETTPGGGRPLTDWEQYDMAVKFDFVDHTQLQMSLADGSQPLAGGWKVLETSPAGCIIEVETATGPDESAELRRFQLEMDERNGTLDGFLLTEVGADRGLGALYFRRPDESE